MDVQFTDKAEIAAVAEWFSKSKKKQLMVGSVKSNVGHTEAVAGFMSVLKALFALDSSVISPNLHLENLNNDIKAIQGNRFQVVIQISKIPSTSGQPCIQADMKGYMKKI